MRLAAVLGDDFATDTPTIAWEESPCLLCGNDILTPLLEAADVQRNGEGLRFLLVKCQHCGLCFTNPRPSRQSIKQFYSSDYPPHQRRPHKPKDRLWKSDPMRKLLPIQGKARLLDFGCGSG